MEDVAGRTALVTGGASGIGLGIVGALLRARARVVVADIDAAAVAAAEASLSSKGEVMGVVLDVASEDSWAAAVETVGTRFEGVDILCNNAGVGQGRLPGGGAIATTEISSQLWRMIFDINVTGVFNGVRAVVPSMIARGHGGHVVNTASMAGLFVAPGMTAYSASKFAVVSMTESLRGELEPSGIGVSLLCPGGVQSNLTATTAARRASNLTTSEGPVAGLSSVRTSTGRMMDAGCVGERVLAGILRNELYIFSHAEYLPIVEERFEAVTRGFRDSAEPGYSDPADMLEKIRNPVYRKSIEQTESKT
jgi:NAD(P)-dependent dehydrogenase (short-subunit alcohol dehydrogenase family)